MVTVRATATPRLAVCQGVPTEGNTTSVLAVRLDWLHNVDKATMWRDRKSLYREFYWKAFTKKAWLERPPANMGSHRTPLPQLLLCKLCA
jgi:hypothetical protein